MGDFHRPTGGSDRGGSSTIEAPAARKHVPASAPAPRIQDNRSDTQSRIAATTTPAPKPAAKPAPATAPQHKPVAPADRGGSSKIAAESPAAPAAKPAAVIEAKPATPTVTQPAKPVVEAKPVAAQAPVTPVVKQESAPSAPVAPKAPEVVAPATPAIEEVVDKTRQGLLTLLSTLAAEEPSYPRDGDKVARAQWLSTSLVKLARVVLNKRPKAEALSGDANARNDLMGEVSAKLKKELKDKFPTTPMPNFLRR